MNQQEFWNGKFLRDGYLYGKEPNEFLKICHHNFKKSQRVLCLGEGEGRNAVFLASKGYDVTAIDASDVGLDKLKKLADEQNVEVTTKCLDLNEWIPKKRYGAIVFSFLHLLPNEKQSLFQKIEYSLKVKGFFIAEVFSTKQLNYESGGPKDEALLYTLDDFKDSFPHCIIHKLEEVEIELEEGKGHKGNACVIRIIAQRS